ncbi:MAG: xanthine dehydrogenase family protein molybdopterin-binding subunit [Gammaproteobacteria bacterium]|nr:xanthine dehydrogenase family protein molybdopterin-binding subunit [Gammaproteobacteria bacterium]MXW06603.1 xanthine dehydrogenase family protein molybdopterin-binding subunit [Gammaproteobacteria bacterium]MYC25388.1 xanthine dehydrogenase family protein molybdopterin-binding subunit [Gammaproteobacteria bacterium]
MTTKTGIGASVLRKEDARFITGTGGYTDDLSLPGQVYCVFVRSPHARASIKSVATTDAENAEGVIAVFTGEDLRSDGIGDLPCGWMVKSKDGSDMLAPSHPAIATTCVNYVGDIYAMVIAESIEAAKNGAELVEADFEILTPVVDVATATTADQIHGNVPHNQCYDWELGDRVATETAFANAEHVTALDIMNNRLIPNAIEPRAALGNYDPASGSYTLYTTSQNPHLERLILAAFVNVAPEAKLHVISPDVGGGFGSKIFVYAEETAVIWATAKVGRPIKWRAERIESFQADAHGRDHVTHAELALSGEGDFLGLRVKTIANMGAYLSTFASSVPTYLYGTLLSGQYKTPAIHVEVKSVFTNTAPVDAYRGAGRPEATYVVERLVETAARELGVDPVELRRKNFIQPSDFPYATPVALTYDTGDYEASLERALSLANYSEFAKRRNASEANGRKRGIGFSCYIEACGLAPSQVALSLGAGVGLFESAEVRVDVTGSVTVMTGTHSHGQGHETTFAQVVSDKLGIPFENVTVVHGDTSKSDYGLGTYGSRSLAVGGSAIATATDKVIAKAKKIAAHMLNSTEEQVSFDDGIFKIPDSNESLSFGEVAFSAYVPGNFPIEELEPGLSEKAFYDPANFTYPAGTHICEVEVDPGTGATKIVSFIAVDDFGTVINPMIVEGQVQGGITQGIGQAMFEHGVYDADGQLLTGSYMDYTMPRADDVPDFIVDTTVTPCTHNPLGAKGCGEAGAIGATAAVMNAITNALDIKELAMPATAETVWRAMTGD